MRFKKKTVLGYWLPGYLAPIFFLKSDLNKRHETKNKVALGYWLPSSHVF